MRSLRQSLLLNFPVAIQAIRLNKLRGILTSLGIVFGVASVISMLAVGSGAQQEILEQMRMLGTNNVIITPIIEQEEGDVESGFGSEKADEKDKFSPGLSLADAKAILSTIPNVELVSPEIVLETTVIREGLKRSGKLVGVDTTYFRTSDFRFLAGRGFSTIQVDQAFPVCVIGYGVRTKFFTRENPIGKRIKVGSLWLTVIGVLDDRAVSDQSLTHLGLRNTNMDIYTPVSTLLLRYKNRTLITRQDIQEASRSNNNDDEEERKKPNYHQLDRLIVQMSSSSYVVPASEVISRMLERRHYGVVDYEVIVPEVLLRQEQRTKQIFNIVLGAIASISLLVGGIGIMNIMLASVLERTKEIGIRRSLGATRNDIVLQFLSESVAIGISGGFSGVILGLILSLLVERTTGILTIVTIPSVLLSFLISAAIGVGFGIFPAKKAADQDPIVSLRYE